jgi:hypothetical protein
MKTILSLFFVFISFSAFSQSANDSILRFEHEKLKEQLLNQQQQVDNMELAMTKYYLQNRNSQMLQLIGASIYVVGAISMSVNHNSSSGVLMVAGGVTSLIGSVLYFDSYKYLDFRRKNKTVKVRPADSYF